MNRNEDNESPLLSIEVQLEKETVNLIINEDDIIEEKIKNFCKKYNLLDFTNTAVTANITLYAKWIEAFRVTYSTSYGTIR